MDSLRIVAEPMAPRKPEPQLIALPRLEVQMPEAPVLPEADFTSQAKPRPQPNPNPTASAAAESAVKRGAVLILEGDLSIRKLLRRLLERRGYFTVEVAQPSDLPRELRDRRADLLIVDVSTPGTNLDAVLSVTQDYAGLKILALSEENLDEKEIPGRLLALPKPFPLDRFIDTVDRLFEKERATEL